MSLSKIPGRKFARLAPENGRILQLNSEGALYKASVDRSHPYGTSMLLLIVPVVYFAIRKFGLRGYWSHNPFDALPERAVPWFRAGLVVFFIGCAVRIIFYS